ncbi:MAG: SMP-30/gluconolactonase/LRE family protein [Dermatophilaceae bacterium]
MRTPSLRVIQVPGFGAEDVVVGGPGRDEGAVFTGTEDGAIVRVSDDGARVETVANTGGRPLGIELDPDGRLVVCDARRGVVYVDPATGAVEQGPSEVGGRPMLFCNNAALSTHGDLWFSDTSTRYGIEHWKRDLVENTRTGRLLRLGRDGQVDVVLGGLAFANGVALARDESFVAVAETAARTVIRHWLTGPAAGTRDLLVTDLPGYPDNIARGSDGLIWVSITSPTDPVAEAVHRLPHWLRRPIAHLPERVQPQPKRTVRVHAYASDGILVHDLDLPADRFHMVTGVREHEGRVWLGSLHEPAVAVLDL